MDILSLIPTDQTIADFIQTVKAEYLIAGIAAWKLLGKPVIMLFKWIASKTPWTSDDELWNDIEKTIDDKLKERIGG